MIITHYLCLNLWLMTFLVFLLLQPQLLLPSLLLVLVSFAVLFGDFFIVSDVSIVHVLISFVIDERTLAQNLAVMSLRTRLQYHLAQFKEYHNSN